MTKTQTITAKAAPTRSRRTKAAPPPEAATTPPPPTGKVGLLVGLLRRPGGARIDEMMAATGWQAHSVRGAMSGAIKKKLALPVSSEGTASGRLYRIETVGGPA